MANEDATNEIIEAVDVGEWGSVESVEQKLSHRKNKRPPKKWNNINAIDNIVAKNEVIKNGMVTEDTAKEIDFASSDIV